MAIANILTIAGSDSGGGAGIQADIKTIMALGGYGMSVITALTAQNGLGVTGIHAPEPEFTTLQLATVLDGFPVAAAKTGMLFSEGIIRAIVPALTRRDFPLVVDPVMVSTSGSQLLGENAITALIEDLLPLADIVTPNIPEASLLTGMEIGDDDSLADAARKILSRGPRAVLVKGGHRTGNKTVRDFLVTAEGGSRWYSHEKVDTANTHGTGCSLSAAIATGLGQGMALTTAIERAERYLHLGISKSYAPGKGHGPINHAANLSSPDFPD